MTAALRVAVYQRAGGRCENPACGVELKPVGPSQFQVDHIYPYSWAPTHAAIDSLSNLQALCRSCNLRKADRFLDFTGRSPWTAVGRQQAGGHRRRLPALLGALAVTAALLGVLVGGGMLMGAQGVLQDAVARAASAEEHPQLTAWIGRTSATVTELGDRLAERGGFLPDVWSSDTSQERWRDSLGSWLRVQGPTALLLGAVAFAALLATRLPRAHSRRRQ